MVENPSSCVIRETKRNHVSAIENISITDSAELSDVAPIGQLISLFNHLKANRNLQWFIVRRQARSTWTWIRLSIRRAWEAHSDELVGKESYFTCFAIADISNFEMKGEIFERGVKVNYESCALGIFRGDQLIPGEIYSSAIQRPQPQSQGQ